MEIETFRVSLFGKASKSFVPILRTFSMVHQLFTVLYNLTYRITVTIQNIHYMQNFIIFCIFLE